jgi:hypothetical protein
MKDNKKLDDLLNAYMDAQLDQRKQTEVKRLLQHDPQIAERLAELEKLCSLVAALPVTEAPNTIVEDVKAKLERRTLLGSDSKDFDEHEGAKHLLLMRAVSAAAIIALAVVLAGVVYTIVGPEPTGENYVVSQNWIKEEIPMPESVKTVREKVASQAPTLKPFRGKLELKTAMFNGVDAFVKRSLVDSGIMLIELPVSETYKGFYNIRCSRTTASLFVADLASIWNKFESATLYVETPQPDADVIVENIAAHQVDDIIAERNFEKAVTLAKNTAVLNAMTADLPGIALAMDITVESLPIPKPVLTAGDNKPKTMTDIDETEMVEMVIHIISSQ